MQITLSEEQKSFIAAQIESGVFENEEHVVNTALTKMKAEQEYFREEIQKGVRSFDQGEGILFHPDEFIQEMKEKYKDQL